MKVCATCGRVITPRKKWNKNFDEVKYCSDACRKNKKNKNYESAILDLLNTRGADKSICPSEVLPVELKQDKQEMELVRASARLLVAKGSIVITQQGQIVDPSTAKGPIRLKLNKRG